MTKVELAKALLGWWTLASRSADPRSWFTEDFFFDSGVETFGIDRLIWQTENALPWSEVRVLCDAVGAEAATLFFEGVEGVTGLRYRVAWFIKFRGELVARLTHVSAIVPKNAGSPNPIG